MKLTVRIFAFCLVLAGAAAASFSSSTSSTRTLVASHQSATAGLPVPICGPGIPCGSGR